MANWLGAFALLIMTSTLVVAEQTTVSSNAVTAEGVTTQIRTYPSDQLTKRPILVVALHGDSPFNKPSYQYAFARLLAAEATNTISVGLLRPGYTDGENRTSDGVRGETVGDNYDAPRIAQIAAAIEQLKTHHNAEKVILAGHSGGSAITAKLTAAYPGLIDHAVVVSCPCDINAWRKDMFENTQYDGFKGDMTVVSPIDVAGDIPDKTPISIFVGDQDRSTREYLNRQYYDALIGHGKKAELTVIEGGHDIFLHPHIRSTIVSTIAMINTQ